MNPLLPAADTAPLKELQTEFGFTTEALLRAVREQLAIGPRQVCSIPQRTESRNVRGETEDREVPATVLFAGSGLVTLDAEGVRLTFRFDASSFDRAQPVFVSGWHTTPAKTRVASVLINGPRTWRFDPQGKLIAMHPE